MTSPFANLDEVVHQRSRLGILVLLQAAGEVDFRVIRDELGLTDGNLSQHLRTLEDASYVDIRKGYEGRRPRTWVTITKMGRRALERELAALRQIVQASSVDEELGQTAKPSQRSRAVRQPRTEGA